MLSAFGVGTGWPCRVRGRWELPVRSLRFGRPNMKTDARPRAMASSFAASGHVLRPNMNNIARVVAA
eukprot:7060127-Lingulodinium_polyedra.AAC.1